MSNDALTQLSKSYPVFEPNQVLTNIHLNDLQQYLDNEDKQTRIQAIGTGIITGLHFTIDDNKTSISISAGAGITTAGYLLVTGSGKEIRYSKCKAYTKPPEELSAIDGAMFWELLPDDALGVRDQLKTVNEVLVGNGKKGVMLMLEEEDVDIKSCFTTNCDDRGKQRHYTIRPLLMVLPIGFTDTSDTTPSKDRLPDIQIERIHVPSIPDPDLPKLFYNACNDTLLNSLQEAITAINAVHKGLRESEITLPALNLITIRERVFSHAREHMQYFYDYISDLIQAYYELTNFILELKDLLNTKPRVFRNYLMLGGIGNQSELFQRHIFSKARLDQDEVQSIKQAAFLLQRLNKMIISFEVPAKDDELRITPSPLYNAPLETRAIPYYYSLVLESSLYRYWNYSLSLRDKSYQVLSYHNTLYNKNPNDMFAKPLGFYHQDKLFLRIEGHVGKTKSQVVDMLIKLKKLYHLPFDIVALKVEIPDEGPDPNEVNAPPPAHHPMVQEFRIDEFLEVHSGVTHECGTPKGGTFIIVFEAGKEKIDGKVIGDLSLPYVCVCGKRDVFIKAFPNEFNSEEEKVTDLHVLENDIYDREKYLQLDFIEEPFVPLVAVDDKLAVQVDTTTNIHVLANDSFDPTGRLELDFVMEPKAFDVTMKTIAGNTIEIQVIKPENVNPGDSVEIDFEV